MAALYEAQVQTVLETTKSIDTCSASTLRLLRALLGFEDPLSDASEGKLTTKSASQKPRSIKGAPKYEKNSHTRVDANFTILNCPEAPIQCLPRDKRLALATNTFNRTLKNLGDAVKRKQSLSSKNSGVTRSPLKERQGRIASVARATSKPAILNQRLPSKSPELHRQRAYSTPPSDDHPGYLATAECATTSLQCLRQLKATDSVTGEQERQLEQGALVLVAKLQGLGFVASAVQETLNIRTNLEHVLRRQQETSKNGTKQERYLSYNLLVDCVEFAEFGKDAMTFRLVTAFQAQVLQLIAVDEKSSIDESLRQRLSPTNPKSPCHIALRGAELGWVSEEKAALQLHSLSQSLLSICSGPSSGASKKHTRHVCPTAQFQLQCLALQMRCHWWHFAHHQPDTDKEVWAPFHRFVVLLRRKAGQTTKVHFLMVKHCLDNLLDLVLSTQNESGSGIPTRQPSPIVITALQNMAEATGSTEDSLDLLNGLKSLCGNLSGVPAAVYQCKLANALLLDGASETRSIIPTLETAVNGLESPLRGTTTQLMSLLSQTSRLRKAAAMRLAAIDEHLPTTKSHDDSHSLLTSILMRTIFGALHFVVRYVSLKLQVEDHSDCALKSSQTGRCSAVIARQSLKSALAAVKSNVVQEYVCWELCCAALADCLSISKVLLNEKCPTITNANVNTEEIPTTFVKVSNLFWSWYLKQKDLSAQTSDLVSALNRSIEALESRSPAEAMTAFLDVKCERAAVLYAELKQFDSARRVLSTAINAHIQVGTLSVVSRKALTQSSQQIWAEDDSSELRLGRVLSAHARLLLTCRPESSSLSFFDKAELKPDERALVLEKQFVALREALVPESLFARLKKVAETVFLLYSESASMLHLLRFTSELLSFCSKNRLRPCQFLPEEALNICMDAFHKEAFSRAEAPSCVVKTLRASVLLQWAFQTCTPAVSLLQAFVNSHTVALESCADLTSILPFINEPALLVAQVQSVIDFTDMQGLWQIKLDALLLLRRLLELQPKKDVSAVASCTTLIGQQYTRMGLTNQAGRTLATAEGLLTAIESKAMIGLQWHLSSAEYLTVLSSYEKATNHLVSAQQRYEVDLASEQKIDCLGSQLAQRKYLAQAAYVASNIAFENGELGKAVLHAKRSVKLGIRQWTMLEKLLGTKSPSLRAERSDSKTDGLTDDLSNMTLSTEDDTKRAPGKGAAFWSHVHLHFDCLLNLSRLSAHLGSFQDALYYAEQATKIGEATGSDVLLCEASALLSMYLAQAGRLDESQLLLDSCASSYEFIGSSAVAFRVSMAMARAYFARSEAIPGSEAVEQARRMLSKIQATDYPPSPPEMHVEGSRKVGFSKKGSQLEARNAGKGRKPRNLPTKLISDDSLAKVEDVTAGDIVSTTGGTAWVERLLAEASLLKSGLCLQSGSYEDAREVLAQVTSMARSKTSDVWCAVLQATLMLTDALRLLQSDAVYSVVAESTVAYPSRQMKQTDDIPHRTAVRRGSTSTAVTVPARSGKKISNKQASIRSVLLIPRELISKAHELLLLFSSASLLGSSSSIANHFSSLLTRVYLLASVLLAATSPTPFQITCHLNAAKSLYWSREVASVEADIVLGDKSSVFAWPEARDCAKAASTCAGSTLESNALQQQLHDTLPSSWNVITISMSDDDTELLISKIRRGRSPFLLRLPLERTASEDLDEAPFKFSTAKSELQDIIASANLTAHDAKARSDKHGKKQWWAAREALDARLALLLGNIETLWLGGFRGIFSDSCHDEGLLSRFSESLMRILDRQLPSRRKPGANKESIFQLHSYVLELFVTLGNPDEGDLDDAITDLLYFVIDVLQFQGERNAYDEVDFDAMVLEVNDALRSYHDAAKEISSDSEGHTILILDNALHALPWESLPCLEGQSVTRMPSVSCLQEQLRRMRQDDKMRPGLYINAQKGAYILNPSSDLSSTQETFLDPFKSALVSYTSIVNRAPSEAEFETCLRDKDLCLYFGHGSGAQFIRGRTIKRLKQCAVTFLMGCSSSKMVECGQFEPYGVPYNYIHAGSAAVVGTLWDVTDKDIDRFAMETFVNWGLLGRDIVKEDSKDRARKMKGKGRGRGKRQNMNLGETIAQEEPKKEIGLDDAVAKARGVCVLRYLNGAAPVIYGIPVYLDRMD